MPWSRCAGRSTSQMACWSSYWLNPPRPDPEHREFEALERVGAWERVIA